jgi:ATP-binding cassette subfamily C (CFTR/MRP) protein 1
VDAHVAERLFSDAILDLKARGKAVILVTHALHFLPRVDCIHVLQEGLIREEGTFPELVDAQGPFADLMKDFGHAQAKKQQNSDSEDSEITKRIGIYAEKTATSQATANTASKGKPAELMQKETRRTGHIKSAGMCPCSPARVSGSLSLPFQCTKAISRLEAASLWWPLLFRRCS